MDLLKIPSMLEKHFSVHEHRAVEKFTYRGLDVYISEGGPYYDRDSENPLGWYETAYAVQEGKSIFYQPLRFDVLHDLRYSDAGRQKARINRAKAEAKSHIDLAFETRRENYGIH